MKSIKNNLLNFAIILFIIPLLYYSNEAIKSAQEGLIFSTSVIIPSLFPMLVITSFAVKSGVFDKTLGTVTSVTIMSILGGYPVGAGLINELYKTNKIDKKTAHYMLCYCVNAGPAFVITVIGCEILNSKMLGVMLFISHILASLTIALFCKRNINYTDNNVKNKKTNPTIKAFVESVNQSVTTILRISSYIIFFATIIGVIESLPVKNKFFSIFVSVLEITNSIEKCNNVYIIAFLLGFAGISIWCQIISVSKECGVNLRLFIFSRFLHGILNLLYLNALLHIFRTSIGTITNVSKIIVDRHYSTLEVSISIGILAIFLIYSIENNKNTNVKNFFIP